MPGTRSVTPPRRPARGRRVLRAVAGLVLAALLGPVALAAPARAAAPAGDATTPGIWGTSTVTFVSRDVVLAEVEVPDGGTTPRQPAPPAADGVFTGWVMTIAGAQVPFDVDTTVVTGDLTVTATFAATDVVQFLSPPGLDPTTRVLDTVEVADGAPLGDVAPDVPRVPADAVFTGSWYRQGDPARTPYDLTAPVTDDLVLVPDVVGGFAVSFVTDGTAVDPVFVLEPATTFTTADLAAVPDPTRTGYTFTGWWADAARTQPVPLPLTDDATLYAGWAGETVEYHVDYWLERPGVVPPSYPAPVFTPPGEPLPVWSPGDGLLSETQLRDRSNVDFLLQTDGTAVAGTTVSGPQTEADIPPAVQELVRAQLDPAGVQPDPLTFADLALSETDVVVRGDGSTIVNVYLTRAWWRVDYPLISPGAGTAARACSTTAQYDVRMDVGGTTFYASPAPQQGDGHLLGTFSARAKIGFDLAAVGAGPQPLSQTDGTPLITALTSPGGSTDCVLRGWGPIQISSTIFQASFTGAGADAGSVDVAARTTALTAQWAAMSTQNLTQRFLYTEALDQAPATDQVIGPDGTPSSPLQVATLYNNNRTTVRAAIPPGRQVFDSGEGAWYWASTGDRQVAGVIDGFTSYVGYGTGPATQGNFFQHDPATNRLYQLANSNNSNDRYRYQFYSRNAYDLVFATGGGTAIPSVPAVRYQTPLAAYAPQPPTRGADVFLGWYTDSTFTVPFDLSTATMPASNVVLVARWLVDPHTVTYYPDASAPDPLADLTQTVEDQGTATEPAPLPPRPDGSTFLGWFQRTAEGSFVPFDFDTPVGSDLRLYARWQQPAGSPFAVRYAGAGHTGGTVPVDPWRYDAGASAVVADGAGLVRGTEVFVGWRIDTGPGAAAVVTPRAGPVEGLYQAGHLLPVGGADVTLVAVYADVTGARTVTFRENGGPDRAAVWDAVAGARITYPGASDLGMSGPGAPRTFLGWSVDPAATTADPAYDRLVVGTVAGDLTLYAVWTAAPPAPPAPDPPDPPDDAAAAGSSSGVLSATGAELTLLWLALAVLGTGLVLRRAHGVSRRGR